MTETANPNRPFDYGKGWTESEDDSGEKQPHTGALDPDTHFGFMNAWNDLTEAKSKGEQVDFTSAVIELGGGIANLIIDPIGYLVASGLGFLVDWIQPLEDAIGLVTGNAERIEADAEKWQEVGKELGVVAEDLLRIVNEELASWSSPAAEAARARLQELALGIKGIACEVDQLGPVMTASKFLMEFARDLILEIIGQFVSWLVITWLAALASAGPTMGGSTAAAGAATAANAAVATSRVAMALQKISKVMLKMKRLLHLIAKDMQDYYKLANKLFDAAPAPFKALGLSTQTIEKRPFSITPKDLLTGFGVQQGYKLAAAGTQVVGDTSGIVSDYQSNEDIERRLRGE